MNSAETKCEESVKTRDTLTDGCLIVRDAGISKAGEPPELCGMVLLKSPERMSRAGHMQQAVIMELSGVA